MANWSHVRRGTIGCLMALLLAGCAPDLGPRPQIATPDNYETGKSFSAPVAAWPEERWWTAYGDPQLDALVDEALKDSPDLEIAASRARAAEAAADISAAMLWPTVVGDGTIQETRITQNLGFPPMFQAALPKGFHHAALVIAGVQYQLDFFGKNRATLREALSEKEAAKAEEAEARLQISTGVASYYAVLAQLYADQKTADDAVIVRRQSAEVVEKRFKRGLENEASLSQARAQLEAARVQSAAVAGTTARIQHALAALLGKGPDYALSPKPTKQARLRTMGLPASLTADLIGRRPDVVAARRNVEAAAAGIDVAHANFYPDVDLTALYGLAALDAKFLLKGSSQLGALGPAVHLPIFDYGRNSGIYRASRAKYDAAVAFYDHTLSNALREVADAYSDRKALEGELAHARAALAQSENAYRVIQVRYRAGLAPYLDVLTAENTLLQQRMAIADFEAQAFSYDVALVRTLGGGYAEPK